MRSRDWKTRYETERTKSKVRTGPGKPGKSWNFVMAFSRTEKSWKRATGLESPGNLLNSTKIYEVYGRQ